MPIYHFDINAASVRGAAPYSARSASDKTDDWPLWYVTNDGHTNVLYFPDHPGAVLTSKEVAELVAEKFNNNESPSRNRGCPLCGSFHL